MSLLVMRNLFLVFAMMSAVVVPLDVMVGVYDFAALAFANVCINLLFVFLFERQMKKDRPR